MNPKPNIIKCHHCGRFITHFRAGLVNQLNAHSCTMKLTMKLTEKKLEEYLKEAYKPERRKIVIATGKEGAKYWNAMWQEEMFKPM